MIATGKHFAAIFTNDDATETAAVAAGRRTGDLVHPVPYAPEFHRAEFASKVGRDRRVAAAETTWCMDVGTGMGTSMDLWAVGIAVKLAACGPASCPRDLHHRVNAA